VVIIAVPVLATRGKPLRVGVSPVKAILSLAFLGGPLFIFWIWMLVDCVSRDYREFGTLITSDRSADKLLWLLLVIFLPLIGGIAYHVGVRRRPAEARGAAPG
jgi:hypothetical protein